MIYRIIIGGVGGQGILSIANIIAKASSVDGLFVRQSEIHGMSQRGGSVHAYVTISDKKNTFGDIIPTGSANMILGMEPLESLRYLGKLSASGIMITASRPIENIPNYPEISVVHDHINSLPNSKLVDIAKLSRKAGSSHTANVVLVGIAAKFLPISEKTLQQTVETAFAHKGEKIVQANQKAFLLGSQC